MSVRKWVDPTDYSILVEMTEWRLRVVTFNVAMRIAHVESVERLVCEEGRNEELLVIGLQEVSHGEQYGGTTHSWINAFVSAVKDKTEYSLIGKTYQATNLILIFAHIRILCHIGRVHYRYARNTLGGLTGHKGSIGTLITLSNKRSLVLTLSHFVHDATQLEARVSQYKGNRSCSFPDFPNIEASFWFGDLNFRVEGEANDIIEKLSEENGLKTVLLRDQLDMVKTAGRAFTEYEESPITFPPSYRVFVGTSLYDPNRTPSWCDRILYKGREVTCVSYSRHENVVCSDHLAVSGSFSFSLPSLPQLEWRITFIHIPTWFTTIPLTVRFRSLRHSFWKSKGAYTDWIGVFPSRVHDLTTPLRWVLAMTCYDDSSSPTLTVAEFSPLPAGDYRVGYHSVHYNCILGLSPPFTIVDPDET